MSLATEGLISANTPSVARSAKIFSNPWCRSCGTVVLLMVPVEASSLCYRSLFLLFVLLIDTHLLETC